MEVSERGRKIEKEEREISTPSPLHTGIASLFLLGGK